MGHGIPRVSATISLQKPALGQVLENLRKAGYKLIGPTAREGAVVLDEIASLEDLPRGWMEEQQPGRYRLKKASDSQYFAHTVGPHSWKRYLYPPRTDLFTARRVDGEWRFDPLVQPAPALAFVGVRSCDLAAIDLLDRVFLGGEFRDAGYAMRRRRVFILAVNCTAAAPTCFCTSWGTGPRAKGGFDLGLTELPESFLVAIGSERGAEAIQGVDWEPASAFDLARALEMTLEAEKSIQRQVRTDDLPRMVYDNLESAEWDAVGARCLACGNCTFVCPTCFCSTVEDTGNLDNSCTTRTRMWDSCFAPDYSHVHGGNTRPSIRARYRQWLSHKVASWIEQFGQPGCVGCGRCLTWCPVGIDLTEEIRNLRGQETK